MPIIWKKKRFEMGKNLNCISRSISLVTDSFLFFLRISLPAMLLFATAFTVAVNALLASMIVVAVPALLLALFAFLLQQGLVFALWDVKQRGYAVESQRMKSLYRSSFRKVRNLLKPRKWLAACRYFFAHARQMLTLSLWCFALFNIVAAVICLPVLAAVFVKWSIAQSVVSGDSIRVPGSLGLLFAAVMMLVSYILSAILSPSVLPYRLRRIECDKEDEEIAQMQMK